MKKLILLLLLIPSLAWGQVSTSGVSLSGCSSGGASAAACGTEVTADAYTAYDIAPAYALGHATRVKQGCSWTAQESYTLCRVLVRIKKVLAPSGTLTASIYASDGGSPPKPTGASLGDSSTSYTQDNVTTDFQDFTFDFSGVPITETEDYFLIINASQTNDAANYFLLSLNESAGTPTHSEAGYTTSWSSLDSSSEIYRKIYK